MVVLGAFLFNQLSKEEMLGVICQKIILHSFCMLLLYLLRNAILRLLHILGPPTIPPYNPPPIVKPRLCQPHLHYHQHQGHIPPIGLHGGIAGGNILHKGIETLKHGVQNIGQFFKGHVGSGWTGGGNGAAGYYFHRRSDDTQTDERKHYGINSSKKKRHTRSVNKGWGSGGGGGGFDQVVVPCPVYSSPSLGWPPVRPLSVGLGSLIGWTVPGNQIHGSGYNSGLYQHGNLGGGYGWGGGSNFCRSDYECPGNLRDIMTFEYCFFLIYRNVRNVCFLSGCCKRLSSSRLSSRLMFFKKDTYFFLPF